MNTSGRESAPVTQKKSGAATNPIDFFELHAKAIWLSSDASEDKASKLYTLSDTIRKYLRKVDLELIERGREDDWHRLSTLRAKAYLNQLSEDIRKLAIVCQRQASPFVASATGKSN
jgi:hypothetical protein